MILPFDRKKRFLFFLLGCIPLRILFVIILKYSNKKYLSVPLFIQGSAFLYLYFKNLRLNAPEGGGKTWWANLRIFHGILYIISSIFSYQEKDIAWVPLAIDVILAMMSFIFYHFIF